jgi:hypothetical protein
LRFFSAKKFRRGHHGKKRLRTNLIFLVVLWVVLLVLSLTVLSSVIRPFLRTLQTQSVVSLDWSGYAVASSLIGQQPVVVGVNGSWVVPHVTVSAEDKFSAVWIGIGGQLDKTLIQCGSEHDSINGATQYMLWYEMLPDNSITIPEITVSPGDVINASINLVSGTSNEWLIEISDVTKGQSFRQTFAYNSSQLTAEWVVERPTVNSQVSSLADFGSVKFTGAHATLGSTVGTIRDFSNYEIVMQDLQNNQLVSVSRVSDDGMSFTVNFVQST